MQCSAYFRNTFATTTTTTTTTTITTTTTTTTMCTQLKNIFRKNVFLTAIKSQLSKTMIPDKICEY